MNFGLTNNVANLKQSYTAVTAIWEGEAILHSPQVRVQISRKQQKGWQDTILSVGGHVLLVMTPRTDYRVLLSNTVTKIKLHFEKIQLFTFPMSNQIVILVRKISKHIYHMQMLFFNEKNFSYI